MLCYKKLKHQFVKSFSKLNRVFFNSIFFFKPNHWESVQLPLIDIDLALQIHEQLMVDFAETFEKLAK